MIQSIQLSKKQNKRFKVILTNGKEFNFGDKKGKTYIDHKNKDKRKAYWMRHYANPIEKYRIDNLIPSNALFSSMLLWGNSSNLKKNIKSLNKLLSFEKNI
jgi:hypothetical protein